MNAQIRPMVLGLARICHQLSSREPSAGEREGLAPRMNWIRGAVQHGRADWRAMQAYSTATQIAGEPSAREREGAPLAWKEHGDAYAMHRRPQQQLGDGCGLFRPFAIAAAILIPLAGLSACTDPRSGGTDHVPAAGEAGDTFERGPNNGRMLRDGDFAIELAIIEAGVTAPEFRAWATEGGRPLDPRKVDLRVRLTRLGNRVDEHLFHPAGAFLRGTPAVYEPHSFSVSVTANRRGHIHRWDFDSFEGRTRISPEMAKAFGLRTAVAGPAVINELVTVYGRIVPDPGRVLEVSARFDGAIRAVHAKPGDRVAEGDVLAIVESNESLQAYAVHAPISGVVTERSANAGEQTSGRRLFTIVDASSVWAELSVFPGDQPRIAVGTEVTVTPAAGGVPVGGAISYLDLFSAPDQSISARVVLNNDAGTLAPGTYVTAEAKVARHEAPLAVRRDALQRFGDSTVVYVQVGEHYEVRMLQLGRSGGGWVEVLDGLEPGSVYVVENSYLLKADIEKDGAAHHH